MEKKISKIRKLLGNEYHLGIKYDDNNIQWSLYKYYLDSQVYFSKDNEIIMSSETNTIDDLYKYAKEHHKIDGFSIELTIFQIILVLTIIINVINFRFKNGYITGIVYGVDFVIIINLIIKWIIHEKNYNVDRRYIKEQFKKNIERLYK